MKTMAEILTCAIKSVWEQVSVAVTTFYKIWCQNLVEATVYDNVTLMRSVYLFCNTLILSCHRQNRIHTSHTYRSRMKTRT